jgi:hypothetical protein
MAISVLPTPAVYRQLVNYGCDGVCRSYRTRQGKFSAAAVLAC